MTPEHRAALTAEIARAHHMAEAGQMTLAVKSFDLAREMAHVWADPNRLNKTLAKENAVLVKERNAYRKIHFAHGAGEGRKPLLVLGDSLGLPRTDRKSGRQHGAENTYSWMLGHPTRPYQPTSLCQRYFTTTDALELLREEPALAHTEAALIHLGLNDCAKRIFLEPERLALSLLPVALRNEMLKFAKLYRTALLSRLAARHYVPLEQFQRNLDVLIDALRNGGCGKVVLTTIILPPSRTWPATPGVNENFARYNLAIMEAAARNGGIVLDLNRLVAERGMQEMLIEDGMHLSDAGHKMFTRDVVAKLK